MPEYAWEPRRIYGVAATLCITLLVIGVVNLLKAVILDHVD
jgi:capsular polysaccharide transport system permease protein